MALSLEFPPVAVSDCHVLRCPDFPPRALLLVLVPAKRCEAIVQQTTSAYYTKKRRPAPYISKVVPVAIDRPDIPRIHARWVSSCHSHGNGGYWNPYQVIFGKSYCSQGYAWDCIYYTPRCYDMPNIRLNTIITA